MKNRRRLKVDTNCKVGKVIEKPKLERCNSNNKLTKKEIDLCAKQKVGEKLPYGINYCSSSSVSPSHASS